jgi:very-short-patch-repair endonuclease
MRNYARAPSGAVSRARTLRRNSTDAERKLWRALRETFPSAKFRRQVPHGPYFVDFLSHSAKLVVEVDGSQHSDQVGYDAARTRYLAREGYWLMRVWNNEVLENLDGVLEAIAENLPLPPGEGWGEGGRLHQFHSSPSPSHAASPRGPLPLPAGEGTME